ncbi:MAG: MATE family efflux transporter [SAR324 cluster bacterium]|nr:MATE family efflux transporter [SAR324 cluster bacterium]MCZ6645623.1 MATE family efflux transporter [SAR324 cluster bacterium]MCZ6728831.1 MATE family efflux transporter [SAR324 cluster bacterium]
MAILVEKARLRRILTLALPIMAGMASQNVMNMVDTAMVGTLGNAALAAVGLGGFTTFMCQAAVLGVSAGVQATAARRKGEGREAVMAHPLNAGLLIAILLGALLSVLFYPLMPWLFSHLSSDAQVVAGGTAYVQVRVLATLFVGVNFAFRGYWNAVDRSRIYMITMIIMHGCNILLNYVLIFGKLGAPALGVQGAGMATALATVIGSLTFCLLGWRHARPHGFLQGLPSLTEVRRLAALSLPVGMQNLFIFAGFTMLYWIIGQVGTAELAVANVLINLMLLGYLPAIGLGMSAATLVGQALGRKDAADAARWGWDVVKVATAILLLIGAPMWLAPVLLVSGFIHDAATLELAILPMRVAGATIAVEGISVVLMSGLQGAGDTRRTMVVAATFQWLLFLPLAYLIGPVLGYGLLAIWSLQGVYRALLASVYMVLWRQGGWAAIKV